jgi:hypothetical protein
MKKRNLKAKCGNCFFCEKLPYTEYRGRCHRFLVSGGGKFTEVSSEDWCGEHPDFFIEESEDNNNVHSEKTCVEGYLESSLQNIKDYLCRALNYKV